MKRLIGLLLLLVLLTGCCRIEARIDVDKSGKAEARLSCLFEKEALTQAGQSVESIVFNLRQVDEDFFTNGFEKITAVIDHKDYEGFSLPITQKDFYRFLDDEQYYTIVVNNYLTILDIDTDVFSEGIDFSYLSELGTTATLQVSMPGKILSSTNGTTKNNTVTVDLLSEFSAVTIISEKKPSYLPQMILGGVVILILCSLLFLLTSLRRNRRSVI